MPTSGNINSSAMNSSEKVIQSDTTTMTYLVIRNQIHFSFKNNDFNQLLLIVITFPPTQNLIHKREVIISLLSTVLITLIVKTTSLIIQRVFSFNCVDDSDSENYFTLHSEGFLSLLMSTRG